MQRGEASLKLTPIADELFNVTFMNDTTVAIKISLNIERVSRGTVVTSPESHMGLPYLVNVIINQPHSRTVQLLLLEM